MVKARLESLPVIALFVAIGLFLCSLANALARATLAPPSTIYWVGLLVIALPIFFRLTSAKASDRERLALVLLLGLALYGVKVVHDSIIFTLSDELAHAFNAENITRFHHLYHPNPAISTTAYFPGLEGATSALMMLTGLSSYGAGIIVIGAARLSFMAALFFLFARLSGSARGAAIGVAVYTGTSNFLYWGAQFSYESLSLPLLVIVLMAWVERDFASPRARAAWTVPVVLGILTITITHHLTSYALAFIFIALSILYWVMKIERPNPWPFALLSTATALGWLLIAASSTTEYLGPVLGDAIKAIIDTASGESAPRTLFHQASSAAEPIAATPLPARAIALLAVAVLFAAAFLGVRYIWRHKERRQPLVLLFCAGALGFFAALTLRFAPEAWETGNRAGGYFFIGLAFVCIYGAAEVLRNGSHPLRRRLLVTASLGVILVGGVISGWPWDLQLARPLKATADGRTIVSQPLALAEWASKHLDGSRFAAPQADARLLLAPGGQVAYGGQNPDVEDIVDRRRLAAWQLPQLKRLNLPYVVGDRRLNSEETLRGYYFDVPGQYVSELRPRGVIDKFSELPVGRVWHSGRIVLFDVRDRP